MKYFILLFCFTVLLFSSCGKKEDVVIKKQGDTVNSTASTVKDSSDSSKKIPEADSTNSAAGNKTLNESVSISSSSAVSYINKTVTVTGLIADVVVREKVAYLNFDRRYPKNTFTAVVFPDKFKEFGDLTRFKNKTAEVTGKISTFNGKPQIIMNSITQIKIKE